MQQPQQEAFGRVWGKVAVAAIDGLADPDYPDGRRPALYEVLAGAQECLALCTTPGSLSDPPVLGDGLRDQAA
jgi:hypothetical protein